MKTNDALANGDRRNGPTYPIEILPKNCAGIPANTILQGHNRRAALLQSGQAETVVLVRHDLADADADTSERHFLDENQDQ
jgi:hypothetical protein